MDIYVGNLPYSTTEADIHEIFAGFGDVQTVKIITDRETGRSKGFAFVTLADQSRVDEAVKALDGSDYQGRALRVNPSEPRQPSSGGYGGGYSSGGGGGYGRQERQMYSATCSTCGQEARVPFQPRGDKPVYCSNCFTPRQSSGYGGGGRY